MENTLMLKNPILRNITNAGINNPAGNILEEIAEIDMHDVSGGTFISCFLGNKGRFCTLTVECMPSCN